MEIDILKSSKNELEFQIESLTLAELKDSSVNFAAWKREHPTEKPILLIKTKGKTAKKALNDAVSAVIKDLDKLESDFKKLK